MNPPTEPPALNEAFIRRVIGSSPDCLKILNLDGDLLWMSEGGQNLLEIVDLTPHIHTCWPGWWKEEAAHQDALKAVEEARRGRTGHFEAFAHTFGGTPKWWDVTVSAILGDDGQPEKLLSVSRDITPGKLALAKVAESEQHLRLILESVQDYAIFTTDTAGIVTTWNVGAERLFGYAEAEILGQPAGVLWTPEDRASGLPTKELAVARETGKAEDIRWHQRKDGTRFYATGAVRPLLDGSGNLRGFTKVCRDITAQHQADQELNASRAQPAAAADAERSQLAEVFKRSPSFMAVLRGPEHVFELVNDRYHQLVGHRDTLGKPVREALPEVIGQGFIELLDKVYATGEPFVGKDVRIMLQRAADHPPQERFLDFVYQPTFGPDGAVSGILTHGVDLTERKASEMALANLAEQRRLALDSAQMGWWHLDLATGNVRQDERFKAIYGFTGETLSYDAAIACLHPEDRERIDAAVQAAVRADHPVPYAVECRLVRPDGSVRWVHSRGAAHFEGEGDARRAASLAGTIVDITEAKLSRDALHESEARFRQLADAMPQIVFAGGPDGHLDYYNQQWYDYTGLPPGHVGNEVWGNILHPDDYQPTLATYAAALRAGVLYEHEFRLKRASDGAYRWFLGRALPIKDAAGNVLRWFGTDTDIHERKELQERNEQLLASERAARSEAERTSRMKDEFLATLSHELRTPLNAILGWSQVLRDDHADPQELTQGLATIERNARAQTQIIEDLLDMSKIISGKVRLDVQRIDLAPALAAAIETMRPAADAKGIRLQAVLDPVARPVSGDPNRLQQIFWNLLSNAIKFTPKGGRVQVVLERVNSHLEVSVIDTGEGIKAEFLPHVFDRFRQQDASTTRQHGGLGLGLAIVKQLVELHGGSVRVKSGGPGAGTTFIVALPLTVLHPEAEPPGSERRHPQAGSSPAPLSSQGLNLTGVKVLVVDDEADARALVKRLLEDRGAVVRTAGTVAEAMRLLDEAGPDVLVSDIGMPGEDGYAFIQRVRALGAGHGGSVPAVALTAYARAEDRMKAILAGFQMHVAKPVEPAELLTMVASLAGRTY